MLGTTKEKTGASFVAKASTQSALSNADLAEQLDLLAEKRYTIREAALNAINTTLSQRVCGSVLEGMQEEVAGSLQHILQRADDNEAVNALRCVSLIAISIAEGSYFKQQLAEFLSKIIGDNTGAVSTKFRASAIDTLALIYFMNSELDSEQLLDASYTFSSIFYEENVDPNVCRAAVDSWALVLTLIEDDVIEESLFPENIHKLNELLDSNDYDLRASTGTLIALLVEALRNQLRQNTPEFQEVELGSIDSSVSWDELMGKLDFLSMEKTKGQSKTEGKKQKKIFREIISSIESGQAPTETLTIRDVFLVLDTWAKIAQLDRIRSYLGEGFIHHMANNLNMMHIFDYHVNPDPEAPSPQISKKERRLSLQEADKINTKYMDANRRYREKERHMAGFASEW